MAIVLARVEVEFLASLSLASSLATAAATSKEVGKDVLELHIILASTAALLMLANTLFSSHVVNTALVGI